MSKKKIIAVASHGPALTSIQTTMNTTPTTKAKPTAGPVKKVYAKDEHGIYITSNTGAICRIPMWATGAEADADFILESYTVYHETGLTPRELVERNKQLKDSLSDILESQGRSIEDRLKAYDRACKKLSQIKTTE